MTAPTRSRPATSRNGSPGQRSPRGSLAGALGLGALAGLIAGAIFIVVNMWFATTTGKPPLAPFKMISTVALGPEAMQTGAASVPVGIAVHAGLSVLFGALFGLLARAITRSDALLLAGLGFGLALYAVNFLLVAPAAFPPFTTTSQPFELTAHLVFGALLALPLLSFGRRREARAVGPPVRAGR